MPNSTLCPSPPDLTGATTEYLIEPRQQKVLLRTGALQNAIFKSATVHKGRFRSDNFSVAQSEAKLSTSKSREHREPACDRLSWYI